MNKQEKTLEDELYIWGLIAAGVIIIGIIGLYVIKVQKIHLPPCMFNVMTGLYCPGCGGTRAVKALLSGHILKSIWYHPFVMYGVVVYAVFMISHTIKKFINHNIKAMKYRDVYIYIWIAILILNFIVKNILLVKYGIKLV